MISKYTLRLIKLMVWIAYKFWVCEIKWNKKKQKFVSKSTIRVPLMLGLHIFARAVLVTYFCLFLILADNPILSWDFRLGIAWLFQCLVTTPIWIWTIKNRSFWSIVFNQLLQTNRNMGELLSVTVLPEKVQM